MSGDSSQEKTEQPTDKKIRDAREKGQVARSRHVPTAATMAGLLAFFMMMWADVKQLFVEFFQRSWVFHPNAFDQQLDIALSLAWQISLKLVGIFLAMSMLTAIASNIAMTGFLVSMESMKISFDKIHPKSGFKKIFSKKNLVEFLVTSVVISLIILMYYVVLILYSEQIIESAYCGLPCIELILKDSVLLLSIFCIVIIIVVAAADFKLQSMLHIKELMMTKEEIKKEFKEMEGDPFVSQQRKQIARETVEGPSLANATVLVKAADAVAVVLYYKTEETPVPQVVVKAQGDGAGSLILFARERRIPIVENKAVAEALCGVPSGDYITPELINDVAQILSPILAQS